VPEAVGDGGDFQFGDGLYWATVGLGFDPSSGAGNGPKLYAYDPASDSWISKASTTLNDELVCNEALAYDPAGNRLYATIVQVKNVSAGGDPTLLNKLAIYNPVSNVWTGVTASAPDSWSAGTEAEYLDGRIYVWRGGFNGAAVNGSDSYLDVYDISANSWTRTPSLRDAALAPGVRTGGLDIWGISLSADAAHHRLFLLGAESNHHLYVLDAAAQTWAVGPSAPYDGGWGSSIEFVGTAGSLYEIDGRNSGGTPQGTALLLLFWLNARFQAPDGVILDWSAAGGRSYQVQYTAALKQTSWANLGTPIVAADYTVSMTNLIGQLPQRFFRVGLVP
jgi:hypothetical protein